MTVPRLLFKFLPNESSAGCTQKNLDIQGDESILNIFLVLTELALNVVACWRVCAMCVVRLGIRPNKSLSASCIHQECETYLVRAGHTVFF